MEHEERNFDPKASCAAAYVQRMRRYRERDGLSQAEVGPACTVSPKTISAIENLRRLPTLDVSAKLDRLYEVEYFEEQYWHVIREAGWSLTFQNYSEQEAQADSIRVYDPLHLPGLFQDERYARHLLRPGQRPETLDQAVAARMGRQDILQREEPPFITALIREAVLRDPVGGPEVMREQLACLLKMAQEPRNTVQIIPSGAPVYVSSGFTILGFAEGNDVAFVEAAMGLGQVVARPTDVHRLAVGFDMIGGEALPVGESEMLIKSIMEAL
ncbi:helix-turn-helix domain-containing protein [Actinomadura rudentiformis]|uniref:Helix-turn-helix transcriptional regulator n=1 Tax=Actinomadura rudentiformis TaxID=359158 RepID=A0A6H9Z7T5_9ACTN|nr:helix-turn-helix transcriptional regulator [Actinomadura rudentiformis]KAB2351438.1 helix-turn-helix transcriptional regulator [Actinomadura rudentiformis]